MKGSTCLRFSCLELHKESKALSWVAQIMLHSCNHLL